MRFVISMVLLNYAIAKRCNFQGEMLKCITFISAPYLIPTPGYKENWIEESQTFDITNHSQGYMISLLETLASVCNFTYEIHLSASGTVLISENGTISTTGVFSTFLNQSLDFDLILMALTMTVERASQVKFMHPVAKDGYALVIKNDLDQKFNPLLYINPLDSWVWLVLILLCILPALILSIKEVLLNDEKMSFKKFGVMLATAFSSNFGGHFLSRSIQNNHKMTLIFYFCNGIVIWIAYRANITAGLSTRILKAPFRDLEGLSKSDYFLTTTSKHGATGKKFWNAKPGSVEQEVFKNNMDAEKSFVGNVKGMEMLRDNTNHAHFHYLQGSIHKLIGHQRRTKYGQERYRNVQICTKMYQK